MSIDKIRNIGLDKLVMQVYDFDSLTTDELLCKFAQKINIIIEHFKYLDDRCYNSDKNIELKLQYLLGQGLEEQVAKRLLELINNGTIGKLINEILLKDINDKLDSIESQRSITVILNQFSEIAKDGTDEEDWSLAFNHVFNTFKKEWTSLKIVFSGSLKVRSTINIPYGVSIEGSAQPYSQIIPTSDFVGDFVFAQIDEESHIELRNIFIAFAQNENVGGFYIEQPYDYSILENLAGTTTKKEFIRIGSPQNSQIGQSLKISNCVCYGNVEGNVPLVSIYNHQEMYFENNKILFNGVTNTRIGLLCDGVATSTFINNSIANCNKIALKICCELYPKRIVGNLLIGNLFENTSPVSEDDGVIMITSGTENSTEGQNNQIIANHFMNSADSIKLYNLTNTTIIGVATLTGGRRTFHINPYDPVNNTDPYGNLQISADGGYLVGNFKGNVVSENINSGSTTSTVFALKPSVGESLKRFKVYWDASDTADYGLMFNLNENDILKYYANCWELPSGAGIKLYSSDKSTSLDLGCSNNGKLTVNGVEIN